MKVRQAGFEGETHQTLHWELAARLRGELRRRYQPGDVLESVRELGRRWGVSVAVVRTVQALLEQEGLLEVRHGARVRASGRAGRLRVGLYSELDLLSLRVPSYAILLKQHLESLFADMGMDTEFYMGASLPGEQKAAPSCERFVADLRLGRLDGVVLIDCPETSMWEKLIQGSPVPMTGASTGYNILFDYPSMVREGVRLLVRRGARRIAMLSWTGWQVDDAFHATVQDCGLEDRPAWHRHDLHPQLAGAGWEEFREIWTASTEKPDGLLVCDDVLFGEMAVAIAELGIRIPEQLRIVSHRNADTLPVCPFPVDWLEFSPHQAAAILADMLRRQMQGEAVARERVMLGHRHVPYGFVAARRADAVSFGSRHESGRTRRWQTTTGGTE